MGVLGAPSGASLPPQGPRLFVITTRLGKYRISDRNICGFATRRGSFSPLLWVQICGLLLVKGPRRRNGAHRPCNPWCPIGRVSCPIGLSLAIILWGKKAQQGLPAASRRSNLLLVQGAGRLVSRTGTLAALPCCAEIN